MKIIISGILTLITIQKEVGWVFMTCMPWIHSLKIKLPYPENCTWIYSKLKEQVLLLDYNKYKYSYKYTEVIR